MHSHPSQVFQTTNRTRWRRFKWTDRILLFVLSFLLLILSFTLYRAYNPGLPELENKAVAYKRILNPGKGVVFSNTKNRAYNGFRDVLFAHSNHSSPASADAGRPLRVAFYTNWGAQSLASLDKAIGNIDVLIPEWIFINDTSFLPEPALDTAVLRKAKQHHIKVTPLISNYNTDPQVNGFDGKIVHQLLSRPSLRKAFIEQLIRLADRYQLDGFNIDFEELEEANSESLVSFCRELKTELNKKKRLLSIDVSPGNSDYDLVSLANYNDYLILMAYDQHSESTVPGPVSAQRWIEQALDLAANQISSNKINLGMAAFGYNWPKGAVAKPLTYQEALAYAQNNNAVIDFDNDTYNLHYSYTEKFTDAAGKPK